MRFRAKSCHSSRIGVHLKAFLPPLPCRGKALCVRRGCVRGEGRALFCKKAPFLPPAPPIHPAKNLPGRMTGKRSVQGVPPSVSPPAAREKARKRGGGIAGFCPRNNRPLVLEHKALPTEKAQGDQPGDQWSGDALAGPCSLSSFPARVFEGERGRGGKGGLFAKSPPFPPQKRKKARSRFRLRGGRRGLLRCAGRPCGGSPSSSRRGGRSRLPRGCGPSFRAGARRGWRCCCGRGCGC